MTAQLGSGAMSKKTRSMLFVLLALFLLQSARTAHSVFPDTRHRRAAGKYSALSDSMRPAKMRPSASDIRAFSNFNARHSGGWKVRYSPRTALPEAIVGGRSAVYAGPPETAAGRFMEENRELLKVDPSQLRLSLSRASLGVTHLQYSQTYRGLPVEFSYVRLHVTDKGEILGFQSKFEPVINVQLSPSLTEAAARAAVSSDLGTEVRETGKLVIFPDEKSGETYLAWKFRARGRGNAPGLWNYYVDAHSGKILFHYDDLRYVCATTGTVTGRVYNVDPLTTPGPAVQKIRNQYVWIADYSSRTVTNNNGDYCAAKAGKVFASLKGPYFSVASALGMSPQFDNGGGTGVMYPTPVSSPHPYSNSLLDSVSEVYSSTVTIPAPAGFMKVIPHFTRLEAGAMDIGGTISDGDYVSVVDPSCPAGASCPSGKFIGRRMNPFLGPPVENPAYVVSLRADKTGASYGYDVDYSSYMYMTISPGTTSNATGSFTWPATYYMPSQPFDEINSFYHLNEMRVHFSSLNYNGASAGPVNLDTPAQAMTHASGDPDAGGMVNAFYDPETGDIMIGDASSAGGPQRSFALDSTVIRHEYTHLVMDRIYKIINFGEFGAISEGLADYFSLSSLSCFATNVPSGCTVINTVGYYAGGSGVSRTLAVPPAQARVMPTHWTGEVHEDGLILSQALWELRDPTNPFSTYLGTSLVSNFTGLPRADIFTFNAMFYFPDNFANFYDAMLMSCTQIEGSTCDSAMKSKIAAAFARHGIPAGSAGGDSYEANNGPEGATDISSVNPVTATLYPAADIDYYTFPLAPGNFKAALSLPPASVPETYHAFAMYLFDSDRNYLAEAVPYIINPPNLALQFCPQTGECRTSAAASVLEYPVTNSGRYYLAVAPGPWDVGTYSNDSSSASYTLTLDFNPAGSARGEIVTAKFDNDIFSFAVPYASFGMRASPSGSTMTAKEVIFDHAVLRSHSLIPLEQAGPGTPSAFLEFDEGSLDYSGKDLFGNSLMTGRLRIKPGFAQRYPSVGTVYLEIFGKNHMNKVVSLGVSNPLNLTTSRVEASAWNNILNPRKGGKATVRYDLTSPGHISIKLYTADGSLIKILLDKDVPAGKGSVDWTGQSDYGDTVASGVYLVGINGPGLNKIEKIVVVK